MPSAAWVLPAVRWLPQLLARSLPRSLDRAQERQAVGLRQAVPLLVALSIPEFQALPAWPVAEAFQAVGSAGMPVEASPVAVDRPQDQAPASAAVQMAS